MAEIFLSASLNAFVTAGGVPAGASIAPVLASAGLPAETTIDPYNGKPLNVKWRPGGWMVYSVGSNGVDDGGKLDGKTDIGAGPIETP